MEIITRLKKYLQRKKNNKLIADLVKELKNNDFNVSTLNINKDDWLVLYFDTNVHTVELVSDTIDYIYELFTDDINVPVQLIALPTNASLQKCNKQFIEYYIKLLQQCLLQME